MKKILPKIAHNPQGFTLVELLVVITIIALLSTIGFVSFTSAQTQAKNAKRRADIDAIAKAYESNASTNAGGNSVYVALANGQFASGAIPTPPEGGNYTCVSGPSGGCSTASTSTFKVCAALGTPAQGAVCSETVTGACYCKSSAIVSAGSNAAANSCPSFVAVTASPSCKAQVVSGPAIGAGNPAIFIQSCPTTVIPAAGCSTTTATTYATNIPYALSVSGPWVGNITIVDRVAATAGTTIGTISWHD